MGFFGFVDKLKQLVGINKHVTEDKAVELEDEGYVITDIDDEEIEIEIPQGEDIDEVLQKVYEEDVTTKLPPPTAYDSYFYEFKTQEDKNVCPFCETEATTAGILELQLDPTGTVHAGADEDKIEDWLDYKFSDLVSNPRRDIKLAHRMHEYGGKPSICRCKLTFTGESYSN